MITYKFPEEREFILHYARFLNEPKIIEIINLGFVKSADEAALLSKFFWKLVDQAVIDKKNLISVAGHSELEQWCELIMQSLRTYLQKCGYEKEWENHIE